MTQTAHFGAVDVLGLLAYAELSAYRQLTHHADLAPDLASRLAVCDLAGAELRQHQSLREALVGQGADPVAAMSPFASPVDAFHARTEPGDWAESMVKLFTIGSLARDLREGLARQAQGTPGGEVPAKAAPRAANGGPASTADAEWVALLCPDPDEPSIIAAIQPVLVDFLAEHPGSAGRLSLWSRRLVGELLTTTQRVVADHPPLAAVATGKTDATWADVSRLMTELLEAHARRMTELGLTP